MVTAVYDEGPEHIPILSRENWRNEEEEDSAELCSHEKGLSVWMTALFITGNVVGIGVLSTPKVLDNAGLFGILLLIGAFLTVSYTGIILGKTWVIIQERYSEYRGHVRYPYPAIGQVTYGKPGRIMVSFWLNFSLYGVVIIMMRLSLENIRTFICDLGLESPLYAWAILLAVILIPFTWFGTPVDFWFIAIGTIIVTTVSCVVILTNITYDGIHEEQHTIHHSEISLRTITEAISKISFAVGAHPTFPTLQNDMKQPKKFGTSVCISYIINMTMYLPISVAGYFVYGSAVKDNVLLTVSHGPMLYIVQTLITAHLLFGFIIMINPVCQEFEHLIGIPKDFTWKRCVLRTSLAVCATIVAVSVPSFGVVVSVLGGSSLTLMTYVFPLIFYLKVCNMEGEWEKQNISLQTKIFCYTIIAVGIIIGLICTYSAIVDLFSPRHIPNSHCNITTFRNMT